MKEFNFENAVDQIRKNAEAKAMANSLLQAGNLNFTEVVELVWNYFNN